MFFIPSFTQIAASSNNTYPAKFLLIPFAPSIQLCQGVCPHRTKDKNPCSNTKEQNLAKASAIKKGVTALPIKDVIRYWRDNLVLYVEDGLRNANLFEFKLRELFFIFRSFYKTEEVDTFLALLHCTNLGFRAFIYRHHWDCKNVEDLAELSGLSLTTFKRTFREEFGTSPLQWMNEQKAQYLYHDLKNGDASLATLADRYHFSSISYLCAFCKKMLGDTPNNIRKKED